METNRRNISKEFMDLVAEEMGYTDSEGVPKRKQAEFSETVKQHWTAKTLMFRLPYRNKITLLRKPGESPEDWQRRIMAAKKSEKHALSNLK